jgi:hypothetical protein
MRRCHRCDSRFATFGASWLLITDIRKISQKLFLIFAMATLAIVIIAATLWLSRANSTPSNDAGRLSSPGATAPTGYQTNLIPFSDT